MQGKGRRGEKGRKGGGGGGIPYPILVPPLHQAKRRRHSKVKKKERGRFNIDVLIHSTYRALTKGRSQN